MNSNRIIAILALPPKTRMGHRVPMKLFVENGAPTGKKRERFDILPLLK